MFRIKRVPGWQSLALPAFIILAPYMATENAFACTTVGSGHYYGYAKWGTGGSINGGAVSLDIAKAGVADPTTGFSLRTLWVSTSNDSSFTYWGELGWAAGVIAGVPSTSGFYYAGNRPSIGYFEYKVSGGPAFHLNTAYNSAITYAGGNTWYYWLNGSSVGTSVNHPGPSQGLQTGLESTSSASHIGGTSGGLQWKDTANTWHSNWSGFGYCTPPATSTYNGSSTETDNLN